MLYKAIPADRDAARATIKSSITAFST